MAFSGYVLNQGRVFIAERAFNGADVTGLDLIGDADTVELRVKQKTLPVVASFTGNGVTVANPVIETACTLKIQALDMRLKNWAAATWGDNSGPKAGNVVSGEALILYNGQYAKLKNIGVSGVVIAGATLGLDYVIDSARHGIVRVLPGSIVIPDGIPFATTVGYSYAANNGKVQAFVLGPKFYRVVVAGVNAAQGNQPTVLEVRQVQLEMATKLDFIAKKHMAFELGGELLFDSSLPTATAHGDLSNHFSWEIA